MAKDIYYFGQTDYDFRTEQRSKNAKGTYTHFFSASDRETFNKNFRPLLDIDLDDNPDFSHILEVYHPEDVIKHLNGEISVEELFSKQSICAIAIPLEEWQFNETILPSEQEREDLTDILHDLTLIEENCIDYDNRGNN